MRRVFATNRTQCLLTEREEFQKDLMRNSDVCVCVIVIVEEAAAQKKKKKDWVR